MAQSPRQMADLTMQNTLCPDLPDRKEQTNKNSTDKPQKLLSSQAQKSLSSDYMVHAA